MISSLHFLRKVNIEVHSTYTVFFYITVYYILFYRNVGLHHIIFFSISSIHLKRLFIMLSSKARNFTYRVFQSPVCVCDFLNSVPYYIPTKCCQMSAYLYACVVLPVVLLLLLQTLCVWEYPAVA